MKKRLKKILKITFIILTIIILLLIIILVLIHPVFILIKNPHCFFSGGTWIYFSNTCVDNCGLPENPICGQAFTWGCDCGPLKCWNNEKERCDLDSIGK